MKNNDKIWDKLLEIESDLFNNTKGIIHTFYNNLEEMKEYCDRQMGKRIDKLENLLSDIYNKLLCSERDIDTLTKTLTYQCEECKQGFRDGIQVYNVHKLGGHGYKHICAYCLKKEEE